MRVLLDSEGAEGRGKGMAGIAPGTKKQRAKARYHGACLLCSALALLYSSLLCFALFCSCPSWDLFLCLWLLVVVLLGPNSEVGLLIRPQMVGRLRRVRYEWKM